MNRIDCAPELQFPSIEAHIDKLNDKEIALCKKFANAYRMSVRIMERI